MSWYRGLVREEANAFIVEEHSCDPQWIIGQSIVSHDGRRFVATKATALATSGTWVLLDQPHGGMIGQTIWFQLATVADAYVPIKMEVRPRYPPMPDEVDATKGSSSSNRRAAAVAANSSGHLQVDDDDKAPLRDYTEYHDVSSEGSAVTCGGNDDALDIRMAFVILLVTTLAMAANWAVSYWIGLVARNWLFVLIWSLLGQLLLMGVSIFAVMRIRSALRCIKEYVFPMTLGLTIFSLFWSMAFGIPLAWLASQITAANNYQAMETQAVVNCWIQPNQTFTQTSVNFIYLEEMSWIVDWQNRGSQKVHTVYDTDDDGNPTGVSYNYCVAPLRYTGVVPCAYNLWAVCFAQSNFGAPPASCGSATLTDCGWNLPPNGVTLQTINQNQQFYQVVPDSDDVASLNKAMDLAPPATAPPGLTTTGNVMLFYGSYSPDDIAAMAASLPALLIVLSSVMVGGYMVIALAIVALGMADCCG